MKVALNINRLRFGLAILSRFAAILYIIAVPLILDASRCRSSGDSWPAILGIVRSAICGSVLLSPGHTCC